jgi:hypothetical protein
MANTANAIWATGASPAFTNQVVAFGGRDATELAYHGYVTLTGDGSTATLTVNFIDGTQTPFFTQANPPVAVAPKAVFVGPVNGAASTAVVIESISTVNTTGFVITFTSTLPASAFTIPFIVFPYAV